MQNRRVLLAGSFAALLLAAGLRGAPEGPALPLDVTYYFLPG